MRHFSYRIIGFLFLCLLFLFPKSTNAQELNCKVSVVFTKIAGVEKSVFKDLEKNISEILNNTNWTGQQLEKNAKIPCTFILTIDEVTGENTYQGSLQVQASRPVFESSYLTTLLNHKDKQVNFTFLPSESLRYSESSANNELVAILAFYANLIIGIDQDSFSNLGGTESYKRAQEIAFLQGGQADGDSGWSATSKDINRYWIVKDFLSFKNLRQAIYNYHREGLDNMARAPKKGQKNLLESISGLEKVYNNSSNASAMHVFFDAKANEITEIAIVLPQEKRKKLHQLLAKINPGHLGIYKALE